jgi:hypothetical protein
VRFVAVFLCTLVVVSCGNVPGEIPYDARKFDEAEVAVTVSGTAAECKVSLGKEKIGRVVSCGSMEEYFRDELHLPTGVKYYVLDSGNSHRQEVNTLVSRMSASGYPPRRPPLLRHAWGLKAVSCPSR